MGLLDFADDSMIAFRPRTQAVNWRLLNSLDARSVAADGRSEVLLAQLDALMMPRFGKEDLQQSDEALLNFVHLQQLALEVVRHMAETAQAAGQAAMKEVRVTKEKAAAREAAIAKQQAQVPVLKREMKRLRKQTQVYESLLSARGVASMAWTGAARASDSEGGGYQCTVCPKTF